MSTATATVNPEQPHVLVIDNTQDGVPEVIQDNPNPDTPAPREAPVSHQEERTVVALPPQKSRREEIVAAARARRSEQMVDGEPVFTNTGEQVPAWLTPANDDTTTPVVKETAPVVQDTETFKLKVLGNELNVTFDELAKEADLSVDEAKELPRAALIRLAQKNAAASAYLEEAKAASKSARTARAPGDTTPDSRPDPTTGRKEADPTGDPDSNGPADPDQDSDPIADAIKEIQFGDEKDAAEKLRNAIQSEAVRQRQNDRAQEAHEKVQRQIGDALNSFVAENADIDKDPDLGPIFYGRYVVDEVKAHLRSTGKFTEENINRTIQTPADALAAYEGVAVAGLAKLPDPAAIIRDAASKFRARFSGNGNPNPAGRTAPAIADRQAAKRSLPSQPARTGVPLTAPQARADGQSATARSSVVARMRSARGQQH